MFTAVQMILLALLRNMYECNKYVDLSGDTGMCSLNFSDARLVFTPGGSGVSMARKSQAY